MQTEVVAHRRRAAVPAEFSLSRSAVIHAAAPDVFAQIEDFHQWHAWSPRDRLDPDMTREFSGAERGVGARYSWSGDRRAGAGSMEIVEAAAGRQVVIDLHVTRPVRAHDSVVFRLRPLGLESTDATWTVSGRRGLLARLSGRAPDREAALGRQLEEGLAALEELVTTRPGRAPL